MYEPDKKHNVAFKTALGVVEGGILGAGFDALRIIVNRHIYETFAEPIAFKRPTDAMEYSHSTSSTRKTFLLSSVALGAIIQGFRANKKAKAHNEKVDSWRSSIELERSMSEDEKHLDSNIHR